MINAAAASSQRHSCFSVERARLEKKPCAPLDASAEGLSNCVNESGHGELLGFDIDR
jgi:hypothetical protein